MAGRLVLDRTPENVFAEVEQEAVSPNTFVPGTGPSPEKLLQGGLFTSADSRRHRRGQPRPGRGQRAQRRRARRELRVRLLRRPGPVGRGARRPRWAGRASMS
ncbi:catalase [Kitasatospora sp. NPDC056184]|uniref:catalase n=1 Tax=Kitasatospora sp. NPDC056184 TaxID=3345738 RepID=UPI0035E0844D